MTPPQNPEQVPSLIDIEVLDLGPLYDQAVQYFLSLDETRKDWSLEKQGRLRIRTECRWGRVLLEDKALFLLNEKGEGPKEPLSQVVRAYVALYAELLPGVDDAGFFETKPFCKVPIDRNTAVSFQSLGIMALEDFVRAKIPEMENAYSAWVSLLRKAKAKASQSRSLRTPVRA